MPIYEYVCRTCGVKFDHLARTMVEAAPPCPKCGAAKPEKQLSVFSTAAAAEPARGESCSSCAATGSCPYAHEH